LDVYVLEHGFVLPMTVYNAIRGYLENEVEELVTAAEKNPVALQREFKKRHAVDSKAAFPGFAKMIVDAIIPMRLRHLINKAKTHEFGQKELNWKFCEAVKGKSSPVTIVGPSNSFRLSLNR
jgi:hypothetical protein